MFSRVEDVCLIVHNSKRNRVRSDSEGLRKREIEKRKDKTRREEKQGREKGGTGVVERKKQGRMCYIPDPSVSDVMDEE